MKMSSKITKIPFPGSSGETPSGAMQFKNDWPGLFIRGDDAVSLAANIRGLQQRLSTQADPVVAAVLIQLGHIADIIERDVIAR
jgi:hypothetical protein